MARKSKAASRKPKQSSPCLDLEVLAAEQGVKPIAHPKDLAAGSWPEDESADEFVQTVRLWRKDGKRRQAP